MTEIQNRQTGAGSMRIGPYEIRSLVTSRLNLPACGPSTGARGALLPRSVEVVTRVLILDAPGRRFLIDVGSRAEPGAGGRGESARVDAAAGISAALDRLGIDPTSIGAVLLTHLHHDHAGGLAAGGLRGAEIHLSRSHLDYAESRAASGDAEGFLARDLSGVRRRRLVFVEAGEEPLPGVRAWTSDGHTRSMLGFTIRGPEATLIVPSDLIPTISHLRLPGSGEYDIDGETLAAERRCCFEEALSTDAWIFFYHDPRHVAVRLSGTPERPIAREEVRF